MTLSEAGLSLQALLCLRAMLDDPKGVHHGYALAQRTGLKSVYRWMEKLEHEGWVTSEWALTEKRGPARREYKLTAVGRREARRVLTEMSDELRPPEE